DGRMRAVLDDLTLPGVRAVEGSAEAIPVSDGAADVVASGSAFHWFDLEAVLAESSRVLAPGGVLAFAWNSRDDRNPQMAALTRLIRGDAPRPWIGDRPWAELIAAAGSFGPVEHARFEHEITLPRERLGDLARSYSRIGTSPPEVQDDVERQALALF